MTAIAKASASRSLKPAEGHWISFVQRGQIFFSRVSAVGVVRQSQNRATSGNSQLMTKTNSRPIAKDVVCRLARVTSSGLISSMSPTSAIGKVAFYPLGWPSLAFIASDPDPPVSRSALSVHYPVSVVEAGQAAWRYWPLSLPRKIKNPEQSNALEVPESDAST
jgi:hypothetical protein